MSNTEGNLTHSTQLQVKGRCWNCLSQNRCMYHNVKVKLCFWEKKSTTYVLVGQKLCSGRMNWLSKQFPNHSFRDNTATHSPPPALQPGLGCLHHYVYTVLTLKRVMFPSPHQKDLQSSSSHQRTPHLTCPKMQFCSVRLTPTLPILPMSGGKKDRMFTILSEYRSSFIHEHKTVHTYLFPTKCKS